jgi:hypothetical protein
VHLIASAVVDGDEVFLTSSFALAAIKAFGITQEDILRVQNELEGDRDALDSEENTLDRASCAQLI